jgi:hypothetical protein
VLDLVSYTLRISILAFCWGSFVFLAMVNGNALLAFVQGKTQGE